MSDILIIFFHLIVTVVRLVKPVAFEPSSPNPCRLGVKSSSRSVRESKLDWPWTAPLN